MALSLVSVSSFAAESRVDETALVQALATQVDAFKEFASLGNRVGSVTQQKTADGLVYRLQNAFCRNASCLGGSVLYILDTGVQNKTTGVHIYKTKLERIK